MDILTKSYLATSAVGIGLAVYTANEYLTQNFSSCNINPRVSCGGVFHSGYTSIFGVPFYVLGLIWFPSLFLLGLFSTGFGRNPLKAEILLPLLMIGNVFTLYLWYLELVVIGIICPLCASLYIVNYVLTIISILALL